MTTRKAIDLTGLNEENQDARQLLDENQLANRSGIGGDHFQEPVPVFIAAKNEVVYKNNHNAWIVLGRDRPSGRLSGYGGKGDTSCASIDLVAGRLSTQIPTNDMYVNNNYTNDACRVVLSQKTDIDKNFKLAKGSVGDSSIRSGIGIKADGIRIIGREGIKLVTEIGTKNSQGGMIGLLKGIDLIAGNDDTELQPLVKGENLAKCLEEVLDLQSDLDGILDALVNILSRFIEAVTHHFHISPFFGIPNSPSPVVMNAGIQATINIISDVTTSIMTYKSNVAAVRQRYLKDSGPEFISSRWNNTN